MVQRWGVKGQGGAQEQLAGFSDFFLPVVARALFTSGGRMRIRRAEREEGGKCDGCRMQRRMEKGVGRRE
eukprot:541929-Hanusia_phi.AAC.1